MHPIFFLVIIFAAVVAVRSIRVAWRAHDARVKYDIAFRNFTPPTEPHERGEPRGGS